MVMSEEVVLDRYTLSLLSSSVIPYSVMASLPSIPDRCKSITYSKRGDPKDVIEYNDDHIVAKELPRDRLLIKVEAAGINPVDWKVMKGVPTLWGKKIVAKDYAGTVVKVHESIDRFKVGDQVYGQIELSEKFKNGAGTLVQYAICPFETVAKRPSNLSAIDLGGITTVAQTGLALIEQSDCLTQNGNNSKTPRVLVCGGSSAVGLMAIPILKHKGAFVACTCSEAKFDVVAKRGADETFDYRSQSFQNELIEAAEKKGKFDFIVDCVNSHDVWLISPKILIKDGVYANVGFDSSQGTLTAMARNLSYSLLPTWLGGVPTKYVRPAAVGTRKSMDELEDLINQGVVTPINDSVFEWEQAKEAYARLQTNRTTGKVVIKVP